MGSVSTRKLAVVTGASAGIGLELARECVEHDFDLVICAEDHGIHTAAEHLSKAGAFVLPVQADLSNYVGVKELYQAIVDTGRHVDALLLNAGIGVGGAFLVNDLDQELKMIRLNIESVVHLSKLVLPMMVNRRQGHVLITSSVAATSPSPFLAVYGATKAFDLSFAEALRYELQDTGVTVTALQPGATDTEFFARAGMDHTKVAEAEKDDPAAVAKKGFEAMMAGKDKVFGASLKAKMENFVAEVLPDTTNARIQGKQTEPHSPRHKHQH
jgi:short-subunit dehydrogenase